MEHIDTFLTAHERWLCKCRHFSRALAHKHFTDDRQFYSINKLARKMCLLTTPLDQHKNERKYYFPMMSDDALWGKREEATPKPHRIFWHKMKNAHFTGVKLCGKMCRQFIAASRSVSGFPIGREECSIHLVVALASLDALEIIRMCLSAASVSCRRAVVCEMQILSLSQGDNVKNIPVLCLPLNPAGTIHHIVVLLTTSRAIPCALRKLRYTARTICSPSEQQQQHERILYFHNNPVHKEVRTAEVNSVIIRSSTEKHWLESTRFVSSLSSRGARAAEQSCKWNRQKVAAAGNIIAHDKVRRVTRSFCLRKEFSLRMSSF
jgi:hypothetical protein